MIKARDLAGEGPLLRLRVLASRVEFGHSWDNVLFQLRILNLPTDYRTLSQVAMLIVDSSDNTATVRHANVESHILKGRRLVLTFLSVKRFWM